MQSLGGLGEPADGGMPDLQFLGCQESMLPISGQ